MTVRSGADIRRSFLEFFRDRGHTVVPSASLIPRDPGLLLTVAGMVPFKPYLLGEDPAPYKRAVSSQKCMRTVDIDIVGTTARHLSYFEMLGNFSFGDYFKEKAIPWGFELATEVWGLDADRLWFTVHHSDDEAAAIWIDAVGVRSERVQRRDQDNFWQMGVAGPCGPSSEIFYDRGAQHGPDGGPVVDEERFVEIWNLVFMQHVQDEPYRVVGDLPAKNIDTGAGLERVAVQLQGVDNVFETDLMRPVVAAAEGATGRRYGDHAATDISLRILADHGRAAAQMIGDGVVPSNEGRGYVLRRILRRAVRHAWQLGAVDAVSPRLIDATITTLGDAYPALAEARDGIVETAEREEMRFRRTLESGHSLLSTAIDELAEGDPLTGDTTFKLHDTFGFPVELTEEIAAEGGITIDRAGFEEAMAEQRARARAARRADVGDDAAEVFLRLYDREGPTEFIGYDRVESTGRVLALLREGDLVTEAAAGEDVEVFFDRTPFYAESGGQVGDTGRVTTDTGVLAIDDTQFAVQGLHGHRARVAEGSVFVGQDANLVLDADRREGIRKSHTGTHLLHWALREVLGKHVQQAGSLVEKGRLRFDFSHYEGLDPEVVAEVESVANERVVENGRVRTFEVGRNEAQDLGALAFFGDKYGDRVRVVEAGDYSRELCGGTHVPTTGQVGPVVVVAESSIGSNLRRLEAYTGSAAHSWIGRMRRELEAAAGHLRVPPDKVGDAVVALAGRVRDQEARIAAFEDRDRADAAADFLGEAEQVGTSRVVVAERQGLQPDGLRQLAMQVRDRIGSGHRCGRVGARRQGRARGDRHQGSRREGDLGSRRADAGGPNRRRGEQSRSRASTGRRPAGRRPCGGSRGGPEYRS